MLLTMYSLCFVCATYQSLDGSAAAPAEHIQPAFNNLRDSLPDDVDDRDESLVSYVNDTWISSRFWPPSSWCAFQSWIRTNNDVDGWHNRLNQASNWTCTNWRHCCTGKCNMSRCRQFLCQKTACIATKRKRTNGHKDCSEVLVQLRYWGAVYSIRWIY